MDIWKKDTLYSQKKTLYGENIKKNCLKSRSTLFHMILETIELANRDKTENNNSLKTF